MFLGVMNMPKIIKDKQTDPHTRLNEIIKERNIPLQDIIDHTSLTQSALSMLLTGKRKISLSQIIELADFLDCSIDYLLFRSQCQNQNHNH